MKEENGLEAFNVFASDATTYYDEHYGKDAQSPGAENYTRGYQPLETLPATWYNSILRNLTRQAQQTYLLVSSIYEELKYIVEQGGQTLSDTDAHQILTALQTIFTLQVATGTKVGGVLSSTASNKVLVNADGTMTPNALSDWTLSRSVLQHVNSLYDTVTDSVSNLTDRVIRVEGKVSDLSSLTYELSVDANYSNLTLSVEGTSKASVPWSSLSPKYLLTTADDDATLCVLTKQTPDGTILSRQAVQGLVNTPGEYPALYLLENTPTLEGAVGLRFIYSEANPNLITAGGNAHNIQLIPLTPSLADALQGLTPQHQAGRCYNILLRGIVRSTTDSGAVDSFILAAILNIDFYKGDPELDACIQLVTYNVTSGKILSLYASITNIINGYGGGLVMIPY